MPDPALRSQVMQSRRRQGAVVAIAAAIGLQLATIVLVAWRWQAPEAAPTAAPIVSSPVPVVVSPPAPAPEPSAPPLPPPSQIADRPSCPPPRTDAPRLRPRIDEAITAVHPAPSNAGWIAAWNHEHVFVSYDAGATFTRALDGAGDVTDASFDCWGHLIVLRGNQVGVRDGGRERWHTVPGLRGAHEDPGGVLGGGPDVVVVGITPDEGWLPRLASSADAGATWGYHDLEGDFEPGMLIRGRQHADGAIDVGLASADCMSDDLVWTTIRDGKVDTVVDGMIEGSTFGIYGQLAVTETGWRLRDDDEWHDLPLAVPNTRVQIVPGDRPVIIAGEKPYRLAAGKLRATRLVVEGEPQAVDPAGRVWSIACGQPLIARRKPTGQPATCADGNE